jgi:hypothetical protein
MRRRNEVIDTRALDRMELNPTHHYCLVRRYSPLGRQETVELVAVPIAKHTRDQVVLERATEASGWRRVIHPTELAANPRVAVERHRADLEGLATQVRWQLEELESRLRQLAGEERRLLTARAAGKNRRGR